MKKIITMKVVSKLQILILFTLGLVSVNLLSQDVIVSPLNKTLVVTNNTNTTLATDSAIGVHNTMVGSTATNSYVYGVLNNINRTGNSYQYGVFNSLQSITTLEQYGTHNQVDNTGNNNKYGLVNIVNGGSGNHWGTYNLIGGSDVGARYGTTNVLYGTGGGSQIGLSNLVNNTSDGTHHGIKNDLTGGGLGNHFGIENTISGSGTGIQYGLKQTISNTSNNTHYAINNDISGSGTGTHYGIFQNFTGSGSGLQFGLRQNIGVNSNGHHYGMYNILNGTGTGDHYGSYQELSGSGGGIQYGAYNFINNTGIGNHYGSYTELSGDATGVQYGNYIRVDNSNASQIYGNYSYLTSANSPLTGIINFLESFGNTATTGINQSINHFNISGQAIGINNSLLTYSGSTQIMLKNFLEGQPGTTGQHYGTQNIIDAKGENYGTYNLIEGDGIGNQYGSYQNISNTSSGDQYGTYNTVDNAGSGDHIAGYFHASGGANNYAAIFNNGDVIMNEIGGNNDLRVESMDYTNMFLVDADSNRIGIRTSTPSDMLHINCPSTEDAFRVEVGGSTKLKVYANGSVSFNGPNTGISSNDAYFHNQVGFGVSTPTYRIELENNSSNSQGRGRAYAWDTYSDKRVKSNIKSIAYGLEEILRLHPVSYDHHASNFENGKLNVMKDASRTIGFIAQEVQKILPEVVSVPADENNDLWSMDYEKIIPVLVNAIQQQQHIINNQAQVIEKQNQLFSDLNMRLELLEKDKKLIGSR
jgi:hypothetical protein